MHGCAGLKLAGTCTSSVTFLLPLPSSAYARYSVPGILPSPSVSLPSRSTFGPRSGRSRRWRSCRRARGSSTRSRDGAARRPSAGRHSQSRGRSPSQARLAEAGRQQVVARAVIGRRAHAAGHETGQPVALSADSSPLQAPSIATAASAAPKTIRLPHPSLVIAALSISLSVRRRFVRLAASQAQTGPACRARLAGARGAHAPSPGVTAAEPSACSTPTSRRSRPSPPLPPCRSGMVGHRALQRDRAALRAHDDVRHVDAARLRNGLAHRIAKLAVRLLRGLRCGLRRAGRGRGRFRCRGIARLRIRCRQTGRHGGNATLSNTIDFMLSPYHSGTAVQYGRLLKTTGPRANGRDSRCFPRRYERRDGLAAGARESGPAGPDSRRPNAPGLIACRVARKSARLRRTM